MVTLLRTGVGTLATWSGVRDPWQRKHRVLVEPLRELPFRAHPGHLARVAPESPPRWLRSTNCVAYPSRAGSWALLRCRANSNEMETAAPIACRYGHRQLSSHLSSRLSSHIYTVVYMIQKKSSITNNYSFPACVCNVPLPCSIPSACPAAYVITANN